MYILFFRFVVQYYKIMSQTPEELHKFYKDQSDFVHPPLNNVNLSIYLSHAYTPISLNYMFPDLGGC